MKSSSCEDCVKSDCKQHKKNKYINSSQERIKIIIQNINIYYCMFYDHFSSMIACCWKLQ